MPRQLILTPPADPKPLPLPLVTSKVSAGFPSPADDYVERELDLNELIIEHPSATFYVRVKGDSMINAGILPDDILAVDRAVSPSNRNVVVAILDGELTVKRLVKREGGITELHHENDDYDVISMRPGSELEIWFTFMSNYENVMLEVVQ